MAFEKVMNFIAGAVDIAPPADVTTYTLDGAVAGVAGRVYEFDADGELVLSTTTNVDSAVIALEDADAGGSIRCSWIAPGAIYKVPVTDADGTSPMAAALSATLVVGARAQINALANGMDGENVHAAGNPLTIVRIDRTNEVAWVVFNTCVLNLNT